VHSGQFRSHFVVKQRDVIVEDVVKSKIHVRRENLTLSFNGGVAVPLVIKNAMEVKTFI
jgi:hypothetical protein